MKKITSMFLILIIFLSTISIKADTTEIIKNGSFDSSTSWTAYGGWSGGHVSLSDSGYSGKSVKIINPVTTGNPWVGQGIGGIVPGAEYQVSAYMKTSSGISGIFKTELLNISGSTIKDTS